MVRDFVDRVFAHSDRSDAIQQNSDPGSGAIPIARRSASVTSRAFCSTSVTSSSARPSAACVAMAGRGGRIVPGNGLSGMRERLDSVGGTLALVANKEGGTRLFVSVPCAA